MSLIYFSASCSLTSSSFVLTSASPTVRKVYSVLILTKRRNRESYSHELVFEHCVCAP